MFSANRRKIKKETARSPAGTESRQPPRPAHSTGAAVVREVGPAAARRSARWPSVGLASAELLLEFRHDLEEVADEAVVGDLEDRRLLVLVDGDVDLRVLHAGEVLDRPRDADGDVELGCDH